MVEQSHANLVAELENRGAVKDRNHMASLAEWGHLDFGHLDEILLQHDYVHRSS